MKWCIIMSRLENRKSDIFSIWVNFWIFSGLGLPPNALSKALWNKKMNTLIGSVSKTEITIWNEQIHPCPLLLRIILALQISQKYDGRLLATEHGNRLATLHFKSYQLRVQFPGMFYEISCVDLTENRTQSQKNQFRPWALRPSTFQRRFSDPSRALPVSK